MGDIKENRTIFQICINLNDNIESLKKSRKRLLDLNPCWNYLYIRSQDQFDQIMIDNFKKSNDEFENNIYKLYSEIPNLIHGSSKTEKIHNLKGLKDLAILQRLNHGFIINDAISREIEQHDIVFHGTQAFSINHVPGCINQWHVESDKIHL